MQTVFFDVDTQLDFLYPAGALYVPGAEKLTGALAALTCFASERNIPIISTADAHTEDDAEFKTWKPHCVAGTVGQAKAAATSLPQARTLSSSPKAFADASQFEGARQIIVEKQHVDAFTNPSLRPLLISLQAERYVLYGVVTEVCVLHAAFGLLGIGVRVDLVNDAIKSLSESAERRFLQDFQAKGGRMTTAAAVLNG